jgi:hypothetical protein
MVAAASSKGKVIARYRRAQPHGAVIGGHELFGIKNHFARLRLRAGSANSSTPAIGDLVELGWVGCPVSALECDYARSHLNSVGFLVVHKTE